MSFWKIRTALVQRTEDLSRQRYPSPNPVAVAVGLGILLALGVPAIVRAQVVVAKDVVEVLTEKIFASASKEGLEELTEMGGRQAVHDLLAQAASEGGEALAREVAQYGTEDGPIALRVIKLSPKVMIEALDGETPAVRAAALNAVDRDPVVMTALIRQYGTAAIDVAVRQPGTGEILMQKLGSDGIRLGQGLSEDRSILAARHADEIAKLDPANRASVMKKILSSPATALDFLEAHPKCLLTAAGLTAFLAGKSDLLGDVHTGRPGFIERLASTALHQVEAPLNLILYLLAAGVAVWLGIRLWGQWRRHGAALQPKMPRDVTKG